MSTLVLQHMMRREHVWVGSMLSKEDFGDLRATLIQNQRRKRDSKSTPMILLLRVSRMPWTFSTASARKRLFGS